jgi:hypothetical protein
VNLRSDMRPAPRRIRSALLVAASVGLLASCGAGTDEITADTTCADYLDHPQGDRHDAAVRISSELGLSDGGNPMWGLSFDSGCGSNREFTLREVFGR